jgi:hypothetical protein
MIHLKNDGKDYHPLMKGGLLAVIERVVEGKPYVHLVCKSVSGGWFIVKNEREAGMSKRMENFMQKRRNENECGREEDKANAVK